MPFSTAWSFNAYILIMKWTVFYVVRINMISRDDDKIGFFLGTTFNDQPTGVMISRYSHMCTEKSPCTKHLSIHVINLLCQSLASMGSFVAWLRTPLIMYKWLYYSVVFVRAYYFQIPELVVVDHFSQYGDAHFLFRHTMRRRRGLLPGWVLLLPSNNPIVDIIIYLLG